jgi:hypoxanthine-DNA glycosylase
MKKSFPPIIDTNVKVLILGSMPGEESLRLGQYYANPRNQFWKLMSSLFDFNIDSYDAKINGLLTNHVGLWDVLEYCSRIGSLDSAIKNGIPNKLDDLIKNSSIQVIVFNGQKSAAEYDKHYPRFSGIKYFIMPSTSPANTTPYATKLREWKKIK